MKIKSLQFSCEIIILSSLLLLLLLLSSSSSSSSLISAQQDTGLDNRDAWPPVAPRINATVSPFLVWTFDWTVVGCSFLACFGGLSNGPMAALTIQRFRALRQPIAQQCTWRAQYNAIISAANSTSILDRADTPSGFAIEVDGGHAERFVVGAFWFNLMIGFGVLFIQFGVALLLERYMVKKEEVVQPLASSESGGTTGDGSAKGPPKQISTTSYEMGTKNKQFVYIATKWGFGRVLTGVAVLPFYSAFRLGMIIVANGESSSAVTTQARVAVAIHFILISLWLLIAPSVASRRCFTQSRLNETKANQRKSFLAWLLEDRVRWRFEKMDDLKAMIVVASVENVNNESRWWVVPLEFFVTIALDLGPLAATNPDDPTSACFVNNLTGLIITTLLWWFVLYLRPFQRRVQHLCWFVQLSMQNFSYLLGVLQEQQTAPVPKKREVFIVLCFISCFTAILVSVLFTFLPLLRKIVDKALAAKAQGGGITQFLSFRNWEEDFLKMLQQDQAVRKSLTGSKNDNNNNNGNNDDVNMLDEELLRAIHGAKGDNNHGEDFVNHAAAIANGQERDVALDDALSKFLNEGDNLAFSFSLPSAEYSPASVLDVKNKHRNSTINNNNNKPSAVSTLTQDEGNFLDDFLGNNNNNGKNNNNNTNGQSRSSTAVHEFAPNDPQLYPGQQQPRPHNNNNNQHHSVNMQPKQSMKTTKNNNSKTDQMINDYLAPNGNSENKFHDKDPIAPALRVTDGQNYKPDGEEGDPDENGYYYDKEGNPYYYDYEAEDDAAAAASGTQQEKPNLDWL